MAEHDFDTVAACIIRFPNICHASGLSCPRRALVLPVAAAPVEARRGRHRDARSDPACLEGHSHRAREILLPGLRDDHAAASAFHVVPRG